MEEVYVCAKYDDKRNDFAVSFYEKGLCSLPENQGHGAFCIMMEIMLGEGLSYRYVSKVERTDRLEEGMFPLPALRGYIVKTLKDNGKEVLENPKDVFVSYQLDPEKTMSYGMMWLSAAPTSPTWFHNIMKTIQLSLIK